MIKHIVMWKLKDFAEGKTKEENAIYIKDLLLALASKISEIKKIEVGINIEKSEAAFDAVLYSEFDNENDLLNYQNHPEHKLVASYIAKIRTDRAVVDYNA